MNGRDNPLLYTFAVYSGSVGRIRRQVLAETPERASTVGRSPGADDGRPERKRDGKKLHYKNKKRQ